MSCVCFVLRNKNLLQKAKNWMVCDRSRG